jgi:capsular polysaccharide biosynthesis protein
MTRFAAGIWRRAWIVVLATAGAAFAAHVAATAHPRVHEANAVMLVGPLKADIDTLRASGPLAETYAELAQSRPVLAATDRRLHEPGAASAITTSANQTTRLLTVEARDADAARAARIANAHAATLVALAASPAVYVWLNVVEGWGPVQSGIATSFLVIASRGLLDPAGLHLDVDSVEIQNTKTVAT